VAASRAPSPANALVHVQILAFNDFHGNLEAPTGSNGMVGALQAGGAAYLAAHVRRLRAENPSTVVVSAGDLTGASPLLSSLLEDEPTVIVMNRIGLDFEGLGNHDFDRGLPALARLQKAAKFQYLAANVDVTATHKAVFPPFAIREFSGARVAFIGVTLEGTPGVTVPSAVDGLSFSNEVTTVNALVPELRKQGVSAIVLLIHQGATQARGGTYDACDGLSGDLLPIVAGLSPAIDVIVSGHTHQAYDCAIGGRLVTSAMSYGRLLTKIDLTIDPSSRRVTEKHARNVPVTHDLAPDPEVARLVATYKERAAPIAGRTVGYLKADAVSSPTHTKSPSCETSLGDLIADAQLAATSDPSRGGAEVALMNPGGIRGDLLAKGPGKQDSVITFGEAFEVQPFGNQLVTMTLRGDQLRAVLEAQFVRTELRILQISSGSGYRYTYDRTAKKGTLDAASIRIHGAPLDPAKSYRVTVNSFLAAGGDGFAVLKEGTARVTGVPDLEALTTYLGKASSAAAPLDPARAVGRVDGDGCAF
jgi:5'-nucleotidase